MSSFIPLEGNGPVVVPVKVVKGRLVYRDGGAIPKLKEGTEGDLVLPSDGFLDKEQRDSLTREQDEQLLLEGTQLFLGMNSRRVPGQLWGELRPLKEDDV